METTPDRIAWYRHAFLRHAPRRYAVMQPETADRKYDDYSDCLTDAQIAAHLEGTACYAVPYAYAGLGSVLAFDIDAGGEACALALLRAADERGLWAFGQVDESRGRGYVYVPFDELVNVARLRCLGDQLIAATQRPGWRIENRASEADTRMPLARHRWTGTRGELIVNGARLDLDADFDMAFDELTAAYQENPADSLPPPPEEPARKPESGKARKPAGQGYTIDMFNSEHDLVGLLESYGAKRARGQGRNLYLCPFHDDRRASLLVNRDGDRCRCMSEGSNCPLSGRQYDAFHVFCVGERLTRTQALRRLNGLSDDPEPTPPTSSQNGPGRTEPYSPRKRTKTPAPQAAPTSQESEPDLLTQAATDPNLTRATVAVLSSMLERADAYAQVYASVAQYAERAAISERSARYALRRLEQHGYVEVLVDRGRRGETNVYRIAGRQTVAPTCMYMSDPTSDTIEAAGRGGDTPSPDCTLLQLEPEPLQFLPENCNSYSQEPPFFENSSGAISKTENSDELATTHDTEGLCDTALEQDAALSDLVLQNSPEVTYTERDPDAEYGPNGAIAYEDGAAYVPPGAEAWYEALLRLWQERKPQTPAEPAPLPAQESLAEPELVLAAPEPLEPAEPPRKRRRARKERWFIPEQAIEQMRRAERKIARLGASKDPQDRRQARAIQQNIRVLKHRLNESTLFGLLE